MYTVCMIYNLLNYTEYVIKDLTDLYSTSDDLYSVYVIYDPTDIKPADLL